MEEKKVENNPIQQPPVNKKQNYWIVALIVLASLIVISMIYVNNLRLQKQMVPPPPEPPLPPKITLQPSMTQNETAGWKTYTNSKFDYQFKYPTDHTVYNDVDQKKPALIPAISTSDEVTIAANEAMVFCCEPSTLSFLIEISDKNARQRAEEYLDSVPDWAEEKPAVKNGTFAGLSAVEASGRGGYGPPYKLIVVSKANSLLVIVQNNNDPLLNQILTTFKFTDQKDQVACTLDAKLCPDGSYVSRQGPNCEFAACP